MKCPYCGYQIKDETVCPKCKAAVEEKKTENKKKVEEK